jgi:HEAT repeat protein
VAGRRSFKSDDSFLEKLAIGACGTKKVMQHLSHLGLRPIELERGSTSYKLWKAVKIKRIRVPDILCVANGIRVESRAKTDLAISMSHSQSDSERGWDYGLKDRDFVALVQCSRSGSDPVDWRAADLVQYIQVADLRSAYDAGRVIEERPKGAEEGFELRLTWPAAIASAAGQVVEIGQERIRFERSEDGRTISLARTKRGIVLDPLVEEGVSFTAGRILASVTPVHLAIQAGTTVEMEFYIAELASASLADRYTAAKALSHVAVEEIPPALLARLNDGSEHVYVRMEVAAYLARHGVPEGITFIRSAIQSEYLEHRLEAVIILSEIDNAESNSLLRETMADSEQNPEIRAGAAWSLGELSHADTIDDLVSAFHGVPDVVRIEAARALAKITRENVGPVLDAYAVAHESTRPGVAWALSQMDNVNLGDILASTCHESTDARQWTAFVLGSFEQEKIIGNIERLKAEDPEVYFGVTLLWKIMTSWVFGLKEFG